MGAMNQKTLTRMSDVDGLKGKGSGGVEGIETCGGYRGYLLRNLREDGRMLSKVIDRFIYRARFQALFAIDCERSESSRKQTSLWGHTSAQQSP